MNVENDQPTDKTLKSKVYQDNLIVRFGYSVTICCMFQVPVKRLRVYYWWDNVATLKEFTTYNTNACP